MTACHAKAHLSEVGRFVARTATEVHGGMGFTDLMGLHYWLKRVGFNRQVLGSPERVREEAAKVQACIQSEIKQVMGFRQFSMRGIEKAAGEWTLATLAWNAKRMTVLRMA